MVQKALISASLISSPSRTAAPLGDDFFHGRTSLSVICRPMHMSNLDMISYKLILHSMVVVDRGGRVLDGVFVLLVILGANGLKITGNDEIPFSFDCAYDVVGLVFL